MKGKIMVKQLNLYNHFSDTSFLYQEWKSQQAAGYAILSNHIEDYLPYLAAPVLKLYLFYLIHANNDLGNSYYSNNLIARKLKVSEKTINNWNASLQDIGLISRTRAFNSSSTTQLLPLSDFVITLEDSMNSNNTIESLGNEGYHSENILYISYYPKKLNMQTEKYVFYKRDYTIKQTNKKQPHTITRYVAVQVKYNLNELETSEIQEINNEFSWLELPQPNSLHIVWQNTNINEIKESKKAIILQLKTPDSQINFKQKYDRLLLANTKNIN